MENEGKGNREGKKIEVILINMLYISIQIYINLVVT